MLQLNHPITPGLSEAIRSAGHWVEFSDNQPVCDDEAAVQAIIDGYDLLAEARAEKWAEIKAKREAVKYAGVPIASVGKVIDTDEGARTQQLGLVMMGAALPPGLEWKFADNTLVPMSPALAQEIMLTTAARDMSVFAVAEAYRAQLGTLTDYDQIMALDISAGWST